MPLEFHVLASRGYKKRKKEIFHIGEAAFFNSNKEIQTIQTPVSS